MKAQLRLDGGEDPVLEGKPPKITDLWWTPPEVVDLARAMFPDGYTDPCGWPGAPLTEGADRAISLSAAGLADPLAAALAGRWITGDGLLEAWGPLPAAVNPPWSQPLPWALRLGAHPPGGILICPLRLEARWARGLPTAALLVPPARLSYLHPDARAETGTGPRTSSAVYVVGSQHRDAAVVWAAAHGWGAWEPARLRPRRRTSAANGGDRG